MAYSIEAGRQPIMRRVILAACMILATFACARGEAAALVDQASDAKPKDNGKTSKQAQVRKFTFQYRFRVKGLQPTDDAEKNLVRVWLPRPTNTDCQEVTR